MFFFFRVFVGFFVFFFPRKSSRAIHSFHFWSGKKKQTRKKKTAFSFIHPILLKNAKNRTFPGKKKYGTFADPLDGKKTLMHWLNSEEGLLSSLCILFVLFFSFSFDILSFSFNCFFILLQNLKFPLPTYTSLTSTLSALLSWTHVCSTHVFGLN